MKLEVILVCCLSCLLVHSGELVVLQNRHGYSGCKDTFVDLSEPDRPHDFREYVRLRSVIENDEYRVGLVRFDDLRPLRDRDLRSARLILYPLSISGNRSIRHQKLELYTYVRPWDEGITYGKAMGKATGAGAMSAQGIKVAEMPLSKVRERQFFSIPLPVSLIRGWLAGKNHGLLFKVTCDDGRDVDFRFAASGATNGATRPALALELGTGDSWVKLKDLEPLEGSEDISTQVYGKIESDCLRIRFECHEPEMGGISKKSKMHDIGLWEDDCVELFVDMENQGKHFYQFTLSASGNTAELNCEGRSGRDHEFGVAWQSRVTLEADRWIGEFSLPLEQLEIANAVWRMNACRIRQVHGKTMLYSQAEDIGVRFHNPEKFLAVDSSQLGSISPSLISQISQTSRKRVDYPLKLWVQDGRVVFPTGIYAVTASHNPLGWQVFKTLREAGFDTIVDYLAADPAYLKRLQEECGKHHLKAIVNVNSNTLNVVRGSREHPAVLGYYLADEPSVKVDALVEKYRDIKRLDGSRAVMSCYCNPSSIGYYEPSNDVVMTDPYTRPGLVNRTISIVSEFMDIAHQKVKGKKPVIAILQAFRDIPHRFPTYQELRGMMYLALNHHAAGIIYWTFSSSMYGTVFEAGIWESLQGLNRELALVKGPYCHGRREDLSHGDIDAQKLEYQGITYLVLVNRERPAKTFGYKPEVTLYELGSGGLFPQSGRVSLSGESARVFTSDRALAMRLNLKAIREKVEERDRAFMSRAQANLVSFVQKPELSYANEKRNPNGTHHNNPMRIIDGSRHSLFFDREASPAKPIHLILKQAARGSVARLFYQEQMPRLEIRIRGQWTPVQPGKALSAGALPGYGKPILGREFVLGDQAFDAIRLIPAGTQVFIYELEVMK